jgi:MarR family 2-MHQ and catechol resistance regulon transcriptional repressor
MGSPPRGTAAEATALDAYVKLMRAAESVNARSHVVLPPEITFTQFAALEALLHRGPLFQTELAAKLLKSGGNLTLVVANLERDGLVTRTRGADDRRYVKVALTPKGRRVIEKIFPRVSASITREFRGLDTDEQATLARLCKKLGLGPDAPAAT